MTPNIPLRLALTPGEPAGIGPDLVLQIAQQDRAYELIVIGDPALLSARAGELGLSVDIHPYAAGGAPEPGLAGTLLVESVAAETAVLPGKPDARNASYVLNTIERGVSGCQSGEFAAMVTGPVQKSVINEGGYAFSGHTEYLAELCGSPQPVMLLCAGDLRVALLTTHLALRDVPAAITGERIERIARIVVADLMRYFRIETPRIAVLGLNPHSGEAGQLGREEIDVIIPALAKLKESGVHVTGPLPADSAFTPEALKQCDVVLAMYHDQGLPVLKHAGFGGAINVTLGLPIIRTSVDHGTALEIAGSGTARPDSLLLAIEMALGFARPDN